MSVVEGSNGIREEKRGDIVILHLPGRVDAISSPLIEKFIFETINRGNNHLIFEFSSVEYLSSGGMRMLLSAVKKLKALSGAAVMSSMKKPILEALVVSGFEGIFTRAESLEDAHQKMKNEP